MTVAPLVFVALQFIIRIFVCYRYVLTLTMMNLSPTRELMQRKSLPTKTNSPTHKLTEGYTTLRKSEARRKVIEQEKEQVPQNIQFMFNSLPYKNLTSGRLSDSNLDLHGEKYRRFGESIDHIYGVLRTSKKATLQEEVMSKRSPKKLVKSPILTLKQGNKLAMESKKVFGENSACIFKQSQNASTISKNLLCDDAAKQLQCDLNDNSAVMLVENRHQNVSNNLETVSKRNIRGVQNRRSNANSRRNKSEECRELRSKSLVKCPAENDMTDSDDEISCNIKSKINFSAEPRKRRTIKVVDYSNSSSCTSSASSSPKRKRKRRSSDVAESDRELRGSRPTRRSASLQVTPTSSPLKNTRFLEEVNKKLKSFQDIVEEAVDKRTKRGRGRPKLENKPVEQRVKLKPKRHRKPGSGRPRKKPVELEIVSEHTVTSATISSAIEGPENTSDHHDHAVAGDVMTSLAEG